MCGCDSNLYIYLTVCVSWLLSYHYADKVEKLVKTYSTDKFIYLELKPGMGKSWRSCRFTIFPALFTPFLTYWCTCNFPGVGYSTNHWPCSPYTQHHALEVATRPRHRESGQKRPETLFVSCCVRECNYHSGCDIQWHSHTDLVLLCRCIFARCK